MATQRIFDIQWFTGWESDDIYRWPPNSFYSWENIEVRKNLSWIQLSSKLEDTWWTFDDSISFMEDLWKYWLSWWIIICLENWKIYLNWWSETVWALKTTLVSATTPHNQIAWIYVMNVSWTNYVYFISNTTNWAWKIHRSTVALDFTWWVAYRDYTLSTSSTSDAPCFTIKDTGWFVFGKWDRIIWVSNLEVVTEEFVISSDETIKWFTKFQDNYKIYTTIWNDWVQYIWDWSREIAYYRQIWSNQPVLWVVNNGAYDYAILWFNENYSDLYLISWTQKQELRVNLETNTYARVLGWYLSVREDIIYISWWKTWESDNYGIYTYWNYYPWTAKSLVQSYSLSTNRFTFHSHWITVSYFACVDDKVYKINHENPPTFATSWYVISQVYEGIQWEQKNFVKMELGFKLENQTYFKIYIRKEIWDAWKDLKTIDYSTYWSKRSARIFKNEFVNLLWNFNSLQIKLELFWSTTKTPIIKRVTTFLEVTE